MRFEIARARGFYDAAWPLVPLLRPAGRTVFLAMARTYRALLDVMEQRDYDVFTSRVQLSKWRKLLLRASGRAGPVGVLMAPVDTVAIIGGGLAGLAAATALAPHGFHVRLLESRNRLGGRASSFQDSGTGQLIDACQHVSMGCCTNLAHFCHTVGIDRYLAPQPCLYFMTPDCRVSRFRADTWPAPFHLSRSFLRRALPYAD